MINKKIVSSKKLIEEKLFEQGQIKPLFSNKEALENSNKKLKEMEKNTNELLNTEENQGNWINRVSGHPSFLPV